MKTIFENIVKHQWIIGLCAVFVLVNAFLIAHEWYYFLPFPFAILVVYLAIVALDKLLFVTVFLVPLSVPLENYVANLGFNIQLPTEICLLFILWVVVLKIAVHNPFDRSILYHPVSIAIYINLVWLLVTTITSSMPLVSLKFLISRIWFLAAFYFLASQLFLLRKNIRRYVWMYILSFVVVVIVALVHMSVYGFFNQQAAHISARPFLPDHTSYGAILAMILPFLIGFGIYPAYKVNLKIGIWIIAALIIFALLLSYTRAAWISVGVAFVCFVFIRFRIKFYLILLVSVAMLSIVYVNRTSIVMSMEQNRQDSSKDLKKHLQSIYNIKSDASNLERINRWKSAFKMFEERPVFGWGPGTYMFQYAPFQMARDKTIISTNLGDWGNAHSEYIGPLAESGFLGTLSFLMIIIATFYTALRRYTKIHGGLRIKILLICATLGLITYCTHGFLNNFLDTDKASALFWGFIAIIVAIDVKYRKIEERI